MLIADTSTHESVREMLPGYRGIGKNTGHARVQVAAAARCNQCYAMFFLLLGNDGCTLALKA